MFTSVEHYDKFILISTADSDGKGKTEYIRGSSVESVKDSPDDAGCCVVHTKSGQVHRVEMPLSRFIDALCGGKP